MEEFGSEIIVAAVVSVTALGGAVAFLIKKFEPMQWLADRKALKERRLDLDKESGEWTRDQLELAHAERAREATRHREERAADEARHRASVANTREALQQRITELEKMVTRRDAELSEAYNTAGVMRFRVETLIAERDTLSKDLEDTRAAYARLIPEILARRLREEEKKP